MNREPTWGRQIIAALIALALVVATGHYIAGCGQTEQVPTEAVTASEPSEAALYFVGKTYTTEEEVSIIVKEAGGDQVLLSIRINGNQMLNDVPVDADELIHLILGGPTVFLEEITETATK